MKQKSWGRKYGIHAVICAVILAVAFGINQKINLDRKYIYAIEEENQTILKKVTEIRTEGDVLVFSGWGFDTKNYNENDRCELILQNTETGEALWPKMKKNVEPVEIADRYTDGEDYSGTGFEGSIKISKLQEDSVYEILIRYSYKYINGSGIKQKYVKTVTTDEFLYQRESEDYAIAEYNPKTFQAPEIEGTELKKELLGTRLFYYFPKGMWVYYDDKKLIYVIDSSISIMGDMWFPVHCYVRNVEELPEENRKAGMLGYNNYWAEGYREDLSTNNYKVAEFKLPDIKTVQLKLGLYENSKGWLFYKLKEI